jgi:hypothetical protein
LVEHVGARGELEGDGGVLLHQQDSHPLAGDLGQGASDLRGDLRGESLSRLVDEQQPGTARQPAGDGHHLLLTSRQPRGISVGVLLEGREEAPDPALDLALLRAVEPGAECRQPQAVGHGDAREHPALLRDVADAQSRDGVGRKSRQRPPIEGDRAFDSRDAHDRPEQRRLAGAVSTQQGEDLTLPDHQGDALQDMGAPVEGVHIGKLEQGTPAVPPGGPLPVRGFH